MILAIKNITRNIKNSVVVIILITAITFLFFIGNSVLGKAERSVKESFIESLTGDVVIQKKTEISMNLFSANTPVIDEYFNVPVLPAYDIIREIVSGEKGISGITSQVSGRAALTFSRQWAPLLLCGVEADAHFSLFPGIILEEGRFLQSGEYGVMLTLDLIERLEKLTQNRPEIGTTLRFAVYSSMGYKAKEIPLVGIYKFINPGQFMNDIAIMDPQTVRILNSIQTASVNEADIRSDAMSLIRADADDIFNEGFYDGDSPDNSVDEAGFSAAFLRSYLRENKRSDNYEDEGGDWNFIIIRLEDSKSAASFISSLNKKIEPYGVVAVNWRTAAGVSAILMLLVQALFNAGIFLISITGIIAAINLLLIAVFQRTREIGTLRAIGASNSYIRTLIFSENLFLSFIAGFAGVFSGYFFLKWVSSLGIRINNSLIASLLGGPVLKMEFMPNIAVFSFIVALLLGFAASIYPVEYAVRIEPIAAVRRG